MSSYSRVVEANVRLQDENKMLKQELKEKENVIKVLEDQLLIIYEMYYDKEDKEKLIEWIKEIKGSDKE